MLRRHLWRTSAAVVGAVCIAATGAGDEPPSSLKNAPLRLTPDSVQKVASYSLQARLEPARREVEATGTIRYTNPSARPTDKLYFHLYLNAFEGPNTLFQRGKGSRSGRRNGEPGWIKVHSLTSRELGDQDLWPGPNAHSPGDKDDRTDIKVPLPRPLRAHETIQLTVAFTAKLPNVVERTGFEDDFYLVGQWFPKLAKREADGRWAHFPFHPHGEFYADFGDYDVRLDLPSEYVVGSTGALRKLGPGDPGRTLYQSTASGVTDFVWTAWPHFEVEERKLGHVTVRHLRPAHTKRNAAATWDTLEHGLPHLAQAYGPYPFEQLTVVQPPRNAYRAAGMEYPQFITTGGSEAWSYLGVRDLELLTIHELGHQWFQGILASNEMASPFLDEGLTSYAEARYLNERFGAGSLVDLPFLQVSRSAISRYANLRHPGTQAISTSAPEFKSFRDIGSLVYARSALCLETLGRVYSHRALHEALRTYADEQRFTHPTPKDLFAAIEEVMGAQVREQAELMFERRGAIDWRVGAIETRKTAQGFESHVSVARTGKLHLPTFILLKFEDGSFEQRTLDPAEKESTIVLTHSSPLRWAHIDPARKILLDDNLENNRAFAPSHGPERQQQFQSALNLAAFALAAFAP